MLFDLRSRGRRRTVQAVYLGLAVLMGGGLVLFGVGAGNSFGGILNAFTGAAPAAPSTHVERRPKTTLRPTSFIPRSCGFGGVRPPARRTGQGNDYNTSTEHHHHGKKELTDHTTSERYLH